MVLETNDSALVPPEQREHAVGWLVISAQGKRSHVLPAGDLREHECSADCWCYPVIDDDGDMVVHNAMDRRECVERGEVLKS